MEDRNIEASLPWGVSGVVVASCASMGSGPVPVGDNHATATPLQTRACRSKTSLPTYTHMRKGLPLGMSGVVAASCLGVGSGPVPVEIGPVMANTAHAKVYYIHH
jgi:hypothetical protein